MIYSIPFNAYMHCTFMQSRSSYLYYQLDLEFVVMLLCHDPEVGVVSSRHDPEFGVVLSRHNPEFGVV